MEVLLPTAHRVELLDGGAQAFPRMLAAIEGARQAIHLEIYTFNLDDVGRRFITALGDASRRGVRVRVIVDGWGSLMSGNDVAEALRSSGCHVTIFHPFSALLLGRLRRNHRKLLLVDRRVAFVGGINIGSEYETDAASLGWADLAVEVEGEAVTHLAEQVGGRRSASVSSGSLHIYLSGLGGGRKLRRRYLKAFGSATRELIVAHAYFLPDARVARSLRSAAKRGVAVKLLLAGRSDVPFAHAATIRLYRSFLHSGVRIFEWHQSVLHVKAALVDGQRFLVGSFNLDPLSLANLEALVEANEPSLSLAAHEWLETKLSQAREIRIEDCGRGFLQRWVGDALGLLAARFVEWIARLIMVRRPPQPLPRLGVRRR